MDLFRTIIILPGMVTVIIPSLILNLSPYAVVSPDEGRFWGACAALAAGLFLSVWTVRLFVKLGKGTPAPWNPPQTLVIAGPYRWVRNPMITGVILILAGETLLFQSEALGRWSLIFLGMNMIYFPWVEEPGLRRRFGEAYVIYAKHVPRWMPRVTPWDPDENNSGEES